MTLRGSPWPRRCWRPSRASEAKTSRLRTDCFLVLYRDAVRRDVQQDGKEGSFVPMSDLYGSGFIIEGNRIRGKAASCTIKSRKEDGSTVRLSASCSTNVAVEVMEFNLKIIDDDTVSLRGSRNRIAGRFLSLPASCWNVAA